MIQLQILSKVLLTKNIAFVTDNLLDDEFFVGYEKEYHYILDHKERYGNVPDTATFLSEFPTFELVEVTESDEYLLNKAREEILYKKSVPIIQQAANLLQKDSNAAAEYLIQAIQSLQPNYDIGGTDIIANAKSRYDQFVDRKDHQDNWYLASGFDELDAVTHGIQRTEELYLIFARLNQGKSWVLEKMATTIWETGHNVGYISPEMTSGSVGYRFDTLFNHLSNKGLQYGKDDIDSDEYKAYIDSLSQYTNRFVVASPKKDFGGKCTAGKIRQWVKKFSLDAVCVDGIKYLSDERAGRFDNETQRLTNISEDLMALSIELNVPIICVMQANRSGTIEKGSDDTPEIENMFGSDGPAQNASKVIALHQKQPGVFNIAVKKNRFGSVGDRFTYTWNIDTGEIVHEAEGVSSTPERTQRRKFNDNQDAF